jgi:hypothetical protein
VRKSVLLCKTCELLLMTWVGPCPWPGEFERQTLEHRGHDVFLEFKGEEDEVQKTAGPLRRRQGRA